MLYDLKLELSHNYALSAGVSRNLIRVVPATLPGRQSLTAYLVEIDPRPAERSETLDFFGNRVMSIAQFSSHSSMTIRMTARVEIRTPSAFIDISPALAALEREVDRDLSLGADAPAHFLGQSPRLAQSAPITEFAARRYDPALSSAAYVHRLGQALHDEMTFDANATTVDTDPDTAFGNRRGVCQDMAHIMILGLRAMGVPAGYVSGYLRTLPPKGGVRLEGADAMHAWVRAWCGAGQGWIEYDPTNATPVGTDHIVAGYGRDYADVSPIVGSLRGAGEQISRQSVDVTVAA
jgi:transglutaminase-like putative cysteine protease